MGSIDPDTYRKRISRDLIMYTDQQRWCSDFMEDCRRIIEMTASPARRRAEAEAIGHWMAKHRATYQQIETMQSRLGLSTMEGHRYG